MASQFQKSATVRQLLSGLVDRIVSSKGEERAEALAVDVAQLADMSETDRTQARRTIQYLPSWRALTAAEKAALLGK